MRSRVGLICVIGCVAVGCSTQSDLPDLDQVTAEIEAVVWRFHAADTARDAQALIDLLWPEYEMLVDGSRLGYDEVAAGSREFTASLELFSTEWTDLRITPLSESHAISSFLFRDSIVTAAGELLQSQGPTTLLWERREGVWKLLFGDADHYEIPDPP